MKKNKIGAKLRKRESGQAMVEFALVLPILLLIVLGMLDFGWLFYNQLSLDNAAREGARYAVVNSADEGSEAIIEAHVYNNCSRIFTKDMNIDVEYSKPSDKMTGDVTITLKTKMKVLTPVLGLIVGGQEKEITSAVTMRVES